MMNAMVRRGKALKWYLFLSVLLPWVMVQAADAALTINLVDPDGIPIPGGFRYLIEEDNTHEPMPGVHRIPVPGDVEQNTLAISIHKSHAPAVRQGETAGSSAVVNVPSIKRYVVSVLPTDAGYTLGGANVAVGQTQVDVKVALQPIDTAQVAVKVFNDVAPLNNAPDVGEAGLEGFQIKLFDAAGTVQQDAFGNPLGTTYKPNGDVDVLGAGDILTDANGEAVIKYLVPNKYGINAVPPAGQGWLQTTTIEGTPTIDAWVRPNEPRYLVEFGPPLWHAFYGFVQVTDTLGTLPNPLAVTSTITGQIRKAHLDRPPGVGINNGPPAGCPPGVTADCSQVLIGLNAGTRVVWVGAEDGTGFFTIPNVPPGTYQLVAWDKFLLQIISFTTVIVPDDTSGPLDIPVNMWFGEQEHHVFYDTNGNGVRDPGEVGIANENINLRFRDGSIYQAGATNSAGFAPFRLVFPFFKFQVAEVGFAKYKATGLTATVDDGGPVTFDANGEGKRNPRTPVTETGPVLLSAYQIFAGQNTRFEWGKQAYGPGENGAITGVIVYATTRAEDDPSTAAAETWEPGIPRVQVNLYEDSDIDGVIDDINGQPGIQLADVDNYPLGWAEGGARGFEDVDRNSNGVFDLGDAIRYTHSDSWDDNLPSGCTGTADPLVVHGVTVPISDCSEGLRTWNQAVPGVFDGGYAFGEPGGQPPLPAGVYIVEVAMPRDKQHQEIYRIQREESKNVDFGLEWRAANYPWNPPGPACVGDLHTVPAELELFPGIPAPSAGLDTPLCDRKQVSLSDGQNAAADFHLYTVVPKAARAVGGITDDLANETAPGKPTFTEKFAPGWMPIAVVDYTGKEIIRTYADEFGAYNFLMPSTFSVNVPSPTGVSPKMMQFCLNDPGPIPNPDFGVVPGAPEFITDPYFNSQYSTTCYKFDFWPAKTTYLDTPVIHIAAFTGPTQQTVDCEFPDGTPVIQEVLGPGAFPAYVDGEGFTFTITSAGVLQVPNPDYPGANDPPTVPQFITRNYGFGAAEGTVRVGGYTFPADAVTWSDGAISVAVPSGAIVAGLATGQLAVVKADGTPSRMGVTLHVGLEPGQMIHLVSPGGETIQGAIDAAAPGDLILVRSGEYAELPIMYKKVQLQGAGLGTLINASHFPASKLAAWQDKVALLNTAGLLGLLPGQDTVPLFLSQEGPGILVAPNNGLFDDAPNALIDGFTIRSADSGGGIFVNAYAHFLEMSNLRVSSNLGNFGGGIHLGNPAQAALVPGGVPVSLPPSPNTHIRIHHNQIIANGSLNSGGGIAIYRGADNYEVADCDICGNFSQLGGGGIEQLGVSDNGLIARNAIVLNEVFQGGQIGGGGGGIEIAGEGPLAPATISDGAGNVVINANRIQGNLGGAADGGGISLRQVNGADVELDPLVPANWYSVKITNNMIVNNVGGFAGAGIAMQDTLRAYIVHNTVARNDSTATAAGAFGGGLTQSFPQVAGISSRAHTAALLGVLPAGQPLFSNPLELKNNIIHNNRSFSWDAAAAVGGGLVPNPLFPVWDLGVVEGIGALNPQYCLLTDATGTDPSNIDGDPEFVAPYFNTLSTGAAADEGGNFVQTTFLPLSPQGDYHILYASPARDSGLAMALNGLLDVDFDGDSRLALAPPDRGADEWNPAFPVPPTAVSLAADPLSPQPFNTVITFTATATGGDNFNEFQFYLNGPSTGNIWQLVQAYSPANTWVWNTTAAALGTSTVSVWVREQGAPVPSQARANTDYVITAP